MPFCIRRHDGMFWAADWPQQRDRDDWTGVKSEAKVFHTQEDARQEIADNVEILMPTHDGYASIELPVPDAAVWDYVKVEELELDDGVALVSMEHPPGLIDAIADAITSGKLK